MHTPVTIIGAGPAGMTAALFAARYGSKVRLIDSNEQVGRKLLVTGSGHANLTNRNMGADRYTCADPSWMQTLLARFGHQDLIDFLKEIGILTYSTSDGWCYPLSESAQTVVDAFASALRQAGVELVLNTKIRAIRIKDGLFKLDIGTDQKIPTGPTLTAEKLIVAAGGKASPSLGSRGELFPSLKQLGHTIVPLTPGLAPLTCDMKAYMTLQGMRMDARASLFEGRTLLAETTGNLIFANYGLNGPAVMDLSHHVSTRPGARLDLYLNPLFRYESNLRDLIAQMRQTDTSLYVLLESVLLPRLAKALIAKAGYTLETPVNEVNDDQIEKLIRLANAIPFKVTGVRGFEYCQISAGGVPVTEVDPLNMRSLIVPNLFLVGETLDVVGPCGGYNLQFAFGSGAVAGMSVRDH